MNKSILSAIALFFSLQPHAQTIIQYGKYNVSKDEFVRAFNKNKTLSSDKAKAVREYVDLYANFKLKVRAAEELRVDTSYQQQMDFENFRKQIEGNYLHDERAVKKMMDEALTRSQTDLHLMLYSVALTAETPANDSVRLLAALQQLKKDFSSDPNSKIQEGVVQKDLGYLTVFSMPYRFENMAYALKKGETSELFHNKKGWHFFRLIDQRKAMGKWKLAQILFCFPPNADDADKVRIRRKADSVYQILNSGSEFAAMARAFSEDRLTATSGGEVAEFGTGKYDPVFMQAISLLKQDGDILKPFETSYGFHIVKRIGYTPLADSLTDELLVYEIKQKLMQDSRLKDSRDAFAKEVVKKVVCTPVKGLNQQDVFRFADSAFVHADNESYCDSTPISNKIIFRFSKSTVKGSDWLRYSRDVRLSQDGQASESIEQLWSNYPAFVSLEYYRSHLEDFNPDFAFQLKEFKEGNMLFDIMEKQVWSKASNDSVGLKQYFDAHKNEYLWNESVDVLVFNCNSLNAAKEVQQKLNEGIEWRKVLEMKTDEVQGDSGRFELSQIGLDKSSGKINKTYSDITVNQDGTASFMQYLALHPKDEPRSFEQAKGLIINEYQNILEKKWLDELRKKYPVKINQAVVDSVIKSL